MEQSDIAICPECAEEMPITAEHNGVAWVGHGICSKCGWAPQHALDVVQIHFKLLVSRWVFFTLEHLNAEEES